MIGVDPAKAFAVYLRIRDRLPRPVRQGAAQNGRFLDIVADYDLVLFDAYGVLNVGETAIPGAAQTIAALRTMGKAVAVVSNSAAYPKMQMMERYARLGFDFTPDEVVTSREALLQRLAQERPRRWGLMVDSSAGTDALGDLDTVILADAADAYGAVDGFLLVGAGGWTDQRHDLLEATLLHNPRPVLVGNPDLVAPREGGLSLEPGWFAHRLADRTGTVPVFLGKPFPEVFDLALARYTQTVAPARVLMVGDTLHTDILGGLQAGFATVLVTDYGSLTGLDVPDAIARSGIVPDFVVPCI